MKYLVSWTLRMAGTASEAEADLERLMNVFTKWSQPADTTFHAFVNRIDGRGGYAVVETDSVEALLDGPTKFGPWADYDVIPVVDTQEAVAALHKGREFRQSVG
jgi:hypothetical protein